MTLSEKQRHRYERHLSLPEIGETGQEKLLQSKVLVVGVGGLGSPAAFYLAAAGIGTIGLMDSDTVDISNLQRQILHTNDSVGTQKVYSAASRIRALDPDITINIHSSRFTEHNAENIAGCYDFVIDATDNFDSKFLIAEACHRLSKPYSHAGIRQFCGQSMTVLPGHTACYRCIFHELPADEEASPQGPLGALPGVIGSVQAIEAIKFLLDIGTPLTNVLLTFDALAMSFRKVPVRPDPHCPLCGTAAF